MGRLWCGWVCPGAALGELAIPIRNRLFGPKWLAWIKWTIWIPWISLIAWLATRAGGYRQVNLFFHLGGEVGVESPPGRGGRFWFTLPRAFAPGEARWQEERQR